MDESIDPSRYDPIPTVSDSINPSDQSAKPDLLGRRIDYSVRMMGLHKPGNKKFRFVKNDIDYSSWGFEKMVPKKHMTDPGFSFDYSAWAMRLVKNLPMSDQSVTNESLVIQKIDHILKAALGGLLMDHWPSLECLFSPQDFELFGVTNIKDLFFKLSEQNQIVVFQEPTNGLIYALSVTPAEVQLFTLSFLVKRLLDKHGGNIEFRSFENFFMDEYKRKWHSLQYGLTDLDHLCRALKDIVEVIVNSKGAKVMMKLKHSADSRTRPAIQLGSNLQDV